MLATLELILFYFLAISVTYVAVFALASRFSGKSIVPDVSLHPSFLIIIPAYAEDAVIQQSVLSVLQQKTAGNRLPEYEVCVVSDHMNDTTNAALNALHIQLLCASYENSTKAKALQLAMKKAYNPQRHTHIVILDADNIVEPSFLDCLAPLCRPEITAIQLHRCAKNTETAISLLDAASEEINNSIFRLGHNRLGLSSALIGSGMCFRAEWFNNAVKHLSTAGEDKELERLLLLEDHHIAYIPDIPAYDEKVSNRSNFGQQRRRWLAAQLWSLRQMLPQVPEALWHGRIDYLDKTLQQALIPRSLLMGFTLLAAIFASFAAIYSPAYDGALKWWILWAVLHFALLLALPTRLFTRRLFAATLSLPGMMLQMLLSLLRSHGASHTYIHTEHQAHKP